MRVKQNRDLVENFWAIAMHHLAKAEKGKAYKTDEGVVLDYGSELYEKFKSLWEEIEERGKVMNVKAEAMDEVKKFKISRTAPPINLKASILNL